MIKKIVGYILLSPLYIVAGIVAIMMFLFGAVFMLPNFIKNWLIEGEKLNIAFHEFVEESINF